MSLEIGQVTGVPQAFMCNCGTNYSKDWLHHGGGIAVCRGCQRHWRFKALQAAEATKTFAESSEGIAELIERLIVANLKLFAVCDKKSKADELSKEELASLVKQDLALCKSRAAIRADLNRRLGCDVSGESVKSYGAK